MKSISVVESKFLRSKPSTTFTKLWKETDELKKVIILSNIHLLNNDSLYCHIFLMKIIGG